MKKYLVLVIALALFSCDGKKDIQLPKADRTIVADVQEHSPIYIFFKVIKKDTLADVNRKNEIVSTNWIFNIDKRLPLRLIVPELIKLQAKKDGSMHKNEAAENYFSYANDVKKTMAFLPFTKVHYFVTKPQPKGIIYFKKDNTVYVDFVKVKQEQFANYLISMKGIGGEIFNLCFDKNCSYDQYIKAKVLISNLKNTTKGIAFSNSEYVY